MLIDIVAPSDLAPADIAAWRRLQAADPSLVSPYLSPDWVQAVASVDGPDRANARVAILREDGQAVGFLPTRLGRAACLPVGAPMCDYQGLVAKPGLKVDPMAIVRALGVSRLDFTHLLSDQAVFAPYMRGRSLSQVIDISGGYEAHAAERKAGGHGILKDTAQKQRKMAREHQSVEFVPLSTNRDHFEQLIDLKRAKFRDTRQTDIFDAGWTLELVRSLFDRRGADFGGALFTLLIDGKPAALHFALRNRDVLHAWFIAHEQAFERYSPGVALIDHMMRWASEQGIKELDLGPGDYAFKARLANRTRELAHGFVGRPSPATLVRTAQYGVRQAAESLPLGRMSELPGKAMRRLDLWRGLRA